MRPVRKWGFENEGKTSIRWWQEDRNQRKTEVVVWLICRFQTKRIYMLRFSDVEKWKFFIARVLVYILLYIYICIYTFNRLSGLRVYCWEYFIFWGLVNWQLPHLGAFTLLLFDCKKFQSPLPRPSKPYMWLWLSPFLLVYLLKFKGYSILSILA